MYKTATRICISLVLASCLAAAADTPQPQANLPAAEIVAKNVAARGGLEAWRAVKTMSLSPHHVVCHFLTQTG
jgi:hypothetical protein